MKKNVKPKAAKSSSQHSEVEVEQMPDLMTAITKLVERFDGLERKVDLVLGRVTNLPSEMRNAVQPLQRPQPAHHTQAESQPHRPDRGPAHDQGRDNYRERMMHTAVCADCRKSCEVPFRPTEERPVYCKECFAVRKAQAPDRRNREFRPHKKAGYASRSQGTSAPSGGFAAFRSGKHKPNRNGGPRSKKRR